MDWYLSMDEGCYETEKRKLLWYLFSKISLLPDLIIKIFWHSLANISMKICNDITVIKRAIDLSMALLNFFMIVFKTVPVY